MLSNLDPLERRLLADAIGRSQQRRRFRRDPPLMALSNMVLDELQRKV